MVEARQNLGQEIHNELKELQGLLEAEGKRHAKQESLLQSVNDEIEQERKEMKRLAKSSQKDRIVLESRQDEITKFEDTFNRLKQAVEAAHASLEKAQAQYQAISTGNFSSLGEGEVSQSLQQQLMNCTSAWSQAKSELQQAEMRFTQASSELKVAEGVCKGGQAEYVKEKAVLDNFENETVSIQKKLEKIPFSPERYEQFSQEHLSTQNALAQVRSELSRLKMETPILNKFQFAYKRLPGLNDQTVLGVLARRLVVKEASFYTALECAGGGKLYSIIVDTEDTGKKLLKSGLEYRVTLIPLNKIEAREIPREKMRQIQNATNNRAKLALSLIDYPQELHPAMVYTFGNVVVCHDNEEAKNVTFGFGVTTVTLDGNKYEPAGIVHGGSPDGKQVFLKLAQLDKTLAEMERLERGLKEVSSCMGEMEKDKAEYVKLERELEIKQHEASNLKTKLVQSNVGQKVQELERLSEEVRAEKEKIEEAKQTLRAQQALKAELEGKISNIDQYREQEVGRAQEQLQQCEHSVLSSVIG